MPTNSLTKAQMAAHLEQVFVPDHNTPVPAEYYVVLAALHALPDDHYIMHDPEAGDLIPGALRALSGPVVANFEKLPASMGYGDLTLLATRAGPGLLVNLGGSEGLSASSFWVVPAGLEGWYAAED